MTDHAKALADALAELDEAYCRAGTKLTQAERHQDRKRLINARQVLAAYRATQQAAALDELIASGEEIDNALAQQAHPESFADQGLASENGGCRPTPSLTVGDEPVAEYTKVFGVRWLSKQPYELLAGAELVDAAGDAYYRITSPAGMDCLRREADTVPGTKFYLRSAKPAAQAEPGCKLVPVEDLRKLAKLTEFNTSALAAHVAAMANKWLKSEPATTQPQPSPTQEP